MDSSCWGVSLLLGKSIPYFPSYLESYGRTNYISMDLCFGSCYAPAEQQAAVSQTFALLCCQSAIGKAVAGLNMFSFSMFGVFFVDEIQRQWL